MDNSNKRQREDGSSPLPERPKKMSAVADFKWTKANVTQMITLLRRYHNTKNRDDPGFMKDVWEFVVNHFEPEKPTKIGVAKKFHALKLEYGIIEELLTKPGFIWDDEEFKVIASESKWKSLGQDREKYEKYRKQSFEWFEALRQMLGVGPAQEADAQDSDVSYQKRKWKINYKRADANSRNKYCQRCQRNHTRCNMKQPCDYCLGMKDGDNCKYGSEWNDLVQKWEAEKAAGNVEPVVRPVTNDDIAQLPEYEYTPSQGPQTRNVTPALFRVVPSGETPNDGQDVAAPSTPTTPTGRGAANGSGANAPIVWDVPSTTALLEKYLVVRADFYRRNGTLVGKASQIYEELSASFTTSTGRKPVATAIDRRMRRMKTSFDEILFVLQRPGFTWNNVDCVPEGPDDMWGDLPEVYRRHRFTAFPWFELMHKVVAPFFGDNYNSASSDEGGDDEQEDMFGNPSPNAGSGRSGAPAQRGRLSLSNGGARGQRNMAITDVLNDDDLSDAVNTPGGQRNHGSGSRLAMVSNTGYDLADSSPGYNIGNSVEDGQYPSQANAVDDDEIVARARERLLEEVCLTRRGFEFFTHEKFADPWSANEYLKCTTAGSRRTWLKNTLIEFFDGEIHELWNYSGYHGRN